MVHTIITKGLLILSSRKYKFEMDGQQFVFDGERVALCTLDNLESQKNASFRHRHSIPEFRTSYLNTVALTLTNSCNLTCEYCFANQGKYDIPNLHMSYETAKKSIDLVIESVKKNNSDSIKVAFFGGEPLLAFDLIEKIVNYTNENIPQILIQVCRFYQIMDVPIILYLVGIHLVFSHLLMVYTAAL